jgi:transcriptional regulator with XRE-family HTH domain
MNSFGELLHDARTDRNLTQSAVSNALTDFLSQTNSAKTAIPVQSYIARLESGRGGFPDSMIMAGLAHTLNIPYDRLLAALMKDKYGQENRHEVFYPFEKGMLTLSELASWEASATHVETWVVVEEYMDDRRQDFREAVQEILRQGHTITFFMASGRERMVAMYRDELSSELGRTVTTNEVQYAPLSITERSLLVNPFVLTSETGLINYHHAAEPMGYQLLTDDYGDPHVAIKLSRREALDRYRSLKILLSQLRKAA